LWSRLESATHSSWIDDIREGGIMFVQLIGLLMGSKVPYTLYNFVQLISDDMNEWEKQFREIKDSQEIKYYY
jgi:hypothetical protein